MALHLLIATSTSPANEQTMNRKTKDNAIVMGVVNDWFMITISCYNLQMQFNLLYTLLIRIYLIKSSLKIFLSILYLNNTNYLKNKNIVGQEINLQYMYTIIQQMLV